jgi:hypothetical protein
VQWELVTRHFVSRTVFAALALVLEICMPAKATAETKQMNFKRLRMCAPDAAILFVIRKVVAAYFSMSRCVTLEEKPCFARDFFICSPSMTERCFPPVQPMAIVK